MLEWSKKKSKKSGQLGSLADAYDDLLYEYKTSANYQNPQGAQMTAPQPQTISVDEMQNRLETYLDQLQLHNITLTLQKSTPQTWEEMHFCYASYQKLRPVFLKYMGFHDADSCRKIGFNEDDIILLQQGSVPENFNTHLKIPFDFGGIADLQNFSLVQTHPTHDKLHKIIDFQIETNFLRLQKMIFIPWFEGRLYYAQ